MAENEKHDETELTKEDYRTGKIDFVNAMLHLRQAGHSPAQAKQIVLELIKEKHNAKADN